MLVTVTTAGDAISYTCDTAVGFEAPALVCNSGVLPPVLAAATDGAVPADVGAVAAVDDEVSDFGAQAAQRLTASRTDADLLVKMFVCTMSSKCRGARREARSEPLHSGAQSPEEQSQRP